MIESDPLHASLEIFASIPHEGIPVIFLPITLIEPFFNKKFSIFNKNFLVTFLWSFAGIFVWINILGFVLGFFVGDTSKLIIYKHNSFMGIKNHDCSHFQY